MFFKRADCLMIGKYNKPPRKQENFERQDSGEVYNGLADYI